MNLGRAIKTVRVQRGISQEELASLTGLSNGYISLLERDKRDPTMDTLAIMAKALDIPLVLLIFIASDESERAELGNEVCEKMALLVLRIEAF